ncbi:MAG: hypothetical protein ABSC08_03070 [Bryobacteraceae bacterium]
MNSFTLPLVSVLLKSFLQQMLNYELLALKSSNGLGVERIVEL